MYNWNRNYYSLGTPHEQAVAERLEDRGWEVQRTDLLDPVPGKISVARKALQVMIGRNKLRDLPDLFAAKQVAGDYRIYWIEVKNCSATNADRTTVSITTEQFENQCKIEEFFGIDVLYVFNDFTVATTQTIKDNAYVFHPIDYHGDKFKLMDRWACEPFDKYFGGVPVPAL